MWRGLWTWATPDRPLPTLPNRTPQVPAGMVEAPVL